MRTQRPEKHMYQIDYISVEMCSQKNQVRENTIIEDCMIM